MIIQLCIQNPKKCTTQKYMIFVLLHFMNFVDGLSLWPIHMSLLSSLSPLSTIANKSYVSRYPFRLVFWLFIILFFYPPSGQQSSTNNNNNKNQSNCKKQRTFKSYDCIEVIILKWNKSKTTQQKARKKIHKNISSILTARIELLVFFKFAIPFSRKTIYQCKTNQIKKSSNPVQTKSQYTKQIDRNHKKKNTYSQQIQW